MSFSFYFFYTATDFLSIFQKIFTVEKHFTDFKVDNFNIWTLEYCVPYMIIAYIWFIAHTID